mmetsp:Transcript_35838/g.93838  ORF Transcript_35838/g.93838 Transcript_35838/m.93838 type:complete len:778 (-) Transcript_35838:369-2702(-)
MIPNSKTVARFYDCRSMAAHQRRRLSAARRGSLSALGSVVTMCSLLCCCGALLISEVAPRGTASVCSGEDWVEIVNNGVTEVDLQGYMLSDRKGVSDASVYTFPSTRIEAGGYSVICKGTGGFSFGVGVNDSVTLYYPNASVVHNTTRIPSVAVDDTWAQHSWASGSVFFGYTMVPTPGAANVATRQCRRAGVCDCTETRCGAGWGWSDTKTRCQPNTTTSPEALARGFCGQDTLSITFEGTHVTTSTEKGEYDAGYQYTINKQKGVVEIISLEYPKFPRQVGEINTSAIGIPASIDISARYIAIGINSNSQLPGHIAIYERLSPSDVELVYTEQICTGPGEVLFNPSADAIVVMCEGEFAPLNTSNNPDGGVGILFMVDGQWTPLQLIPYVGVESTPGLRGVEGHPGSTANINRDLEPEFGDFNANGSECYVVFQENNVMGVLSVAERRWLRWWAFGEKEAQPFDGSDRDGIVNIKTWPVKQIYAPDTVRVVSLKGSEYLVTTNEGDSRGAEEDRVDNLTLDPAVFNASAIRGDGNIGRLLVSSVPAENDRDGNGLVDTLTAWGGRSLSIWNPFGVLIWDSAENVNFEYIVSSRYPYLHNANREGFPTDSFDGRSDAQGPEPDSLALGEVKGRIYAFVGLERAGGIVAIDITDPASSFFAAYTRYGKEVAPERTDFISVSDGTAGRAMLVSTGERSSASNVYFIDTIERTSVQSGSSDNTRRSYTYAIAAIVGAIAGAILLTLLILYMHFRVTRSEEGADTVKIMHGPSASNKTVV